MENKPLAVRLLVVLVSLFLFLISAAGIFLLVDDYVTQKDSTRQGSLYDHLVDNVEFYRGELSGTK